ncbi:ComEC/Rec2 family competence protein [Bryobacter aggregatus]|uniref:ComEC/Rec2 family competence protein n=1 Tax=Bryobacter aggregatus TaxID=360054 RepID=UPI00068BFDFC|nr:hypothetical protein [Bryobacter aggregatus]
MIRWIVLTGLLGGSLLPAQEVGSVLPPWSEGVLDIHQINTGKGNSTLFVLPDGTSLLLDAGAGSRPESPRVLPARPDASRTPGDWIARYVKRVLAFRGEPVLDYALLTHFHDDHMGYPFPNSKVGKGGYLLTGITEVGEAVPIRKLLDRGWPDYAYPTPLRDAMVENYRAFVKWQAANRGLQAERFVAGRKDQVVLQRNAAKYPNFEIRNVLVNTEVWTGVADTTRQQFPRLEDLQPADYPVENQCSLGFRLSYGKFDYGSFGDIPGKVREGGFAWEDMEQAVAKAVGPLEAVVLNHHGNRDSMTAGYLAGVRPQVLIDPVWSADHPGHDVLDRIYSTRIYPGPRDVFATNMSAANRAVIGPLLDRLQSSQGHILIRVAPGGDSFRVVILDDSSESMKVTAVHGPYVSR